MRPTTLARLVLIGLLLLAGCGFQLRGHAPLPFATAYVESAADSILAERLRKHLAQQGKLAEHRDGAEAIIRLSGERRSKNILSLSGAGKVREYRLIHRVTLSAVDPQHGETLAPEDIQLTREFSYSDEQTLAKEAEEETLRKHMEDDALRQILRRLAFVRRP